MAKVLVSCFILVLGIAVRIQAQQTYDVDVCVYGGTSAGVMAAYTAKTLGKNVILIEPGKNVGGLSSGGLGYTDIGNKFAITGLARDFYRRVGDHYGNFEQWTFEPKVAEAIFNDYIKHAGFSVLMQYRVQSVKKTQNKITEIILEHAGGPSEHEHVVVKAKMFIDCGYEGDLMARAGIQYRVGRESNDEYKESINGVQVMEGHQFPDGIDPYRIPGKPASGLLWGISKDSLSKTGSGDHRVQAYNYRICLSSVPDNMVPITRPPGYDSTRYELLLRLFTAWPEKRKLNDYFIWSKMPNNKTDINNRGPFSTDMIGMNYAFPEASYDEREKIIAEHEAYTRGLLYFYGHDERVPEPLRKEMQMWGYPKDEYVENGNWSPQLYIREARRMKGMYVMTQANCEGKRTVNDEIGLAAYTMDSHNCQRIVVNGMVKNEGNVEVGGFGPYPISYRAIVPEEKDAVNFLSPVCLSATHIAYGSIRMEPVFMVLAQSAATAASMAIDEGSSVQNISIRKLQQMLRENPLADGSYPDVLVDNEDKRHIKVSGKKWTVQTEGGYGSSFLVNKPDEKRVNSIRFSTPSMKASLYNVYIYIPKIPDATEFMTVTISDGNKVSERIINPANLVVEGQTSGEWIALGQYAIEEGKRASVEISTKGATGKIIADAVIWTPVRKNEKFLN